MELTATADFLPMLLKYFPVSFRLTATVGRVKCQRGYRGTGRIADFRSAIADWMNLSFARLAHSGVMRSIGNWQWTIGDCYDEPHGRFRKGSSCRGESFHVSQPAPAARIAWRGLRQPNQALPAQFAARSLGLSKRKLPRRQRPARKLRLRTIRWP